MATAAFKGSPVRISGGLPEPGSVIHTELVPQIGQEPDYAAAVAALS